MQLDVFESNVGEKNIDCLEKDKTNEKQKKTLKSQHGGLCN